MGTTALVWSWIAAPGLAAGAITAALALVIFLARPSHAQNRWLALALVGEATVHLGGEAFMYLTDGAATTLAWQLVNMAGGLVMAPAYLLFLGTLNSPWSVAFRTRWGRRVLVAAMVLLPLLVVAFPRGFVPAVHAFDHARWNIEMGPLFVASALLVTLTLVYGFIVAVTAFVRAPKGSLARRAARSYAWAFGVRDLGFAGLFVFSITGGEIFGDVDLIVLPPVITFAYAPLLAYGLLRHQLFGLDLKVKLAVRGSTVAAALAGVFFLIAELVEDVLGIDGTLQGLLAATAIVAVLNPVQRLARRAADALMPGIEDTPAYHDQRAVELYEAAVEGAARDGVVTRSERDVLDALRDRLGLAPITAHEIEARVEGAVPGPTTTP